MPPHDHEEYKGIVDKANTEFTTLKLAIAQLDKKIHEKDAEITVLQEMLDQISKKEAENEFASATPVVVFDSDEGRVVGMSLLYRKKGVAVEALVKNLVEAWQKDGKEVEVAGLPPSMSLKVKGDTTGRGFDFFPTTMLFLRMSKKDREALGQGLELVGQKEA